MLIRGVGIELAGRWYGKLAAGLQTGRSLNLPYAAVRCTASDVRKSRAVRECPAVRSPDSGSRLNAAPPRQTEGGTANSQFERCMGSE